MTKKTRTARPREVDRLDLWTLGAKPLRADDAKRTIGDFSSFELCVVLSRRGFDVHIARPTKRELERRKKHADSLPNPFDAGRAKSKKGARPR